MGSGENAPYDVVCSVVTIARLCVCKSGGPDSGRRLCVESAPLLFMGAANRVNLRRLTLGYSLQGSQCSSEDLGMSRQQFRRDSHLVGLE